MNVSVSVSVSSLSLSFALRLVYFCVVRNEGNNDGLIVRQTTVSNSFLNLKKKTKKKNIRG